MNITLNSSQSRHWMVKFVWNRCYDTWIARNQALHRNNQQSSYPARKHQAQHLHNYQKSELQHVCNGWLCPSLEEQLRRIPDPSPLDNFYP
jgi:hypothetical protein